MSESKSPRRGFAAADRRPAGEARVSGWCAAMSLSGFCLIAAVISSRPLQAQACTMSENCTGDLTTGGCGFDAGSACVPPPSVKGTCSGNGVGNCAGTYNCVAPIATPQGVQILGGSGGTYTARLTVDVVAPFNTWAGLNNNNPNGTLQLTWYDSPSVPDICDTSVSTSLCSLKSTDHGQFWLDKTGLTCAGAPYDFVVSALFFTCQQPTCPCEMLTGDPNCNCNGVTSQPLSNLHITVPKASLPGCTPPPEFCTEAGGAGGAAGGGGGAGGPGGASTGRWMAETGTKGNGPGSGAAGTTGGGNCQSCTQLGSSAGDGSGCGFSNAGGGSSCSFAGPGANLRYGAGGVGSPGFPGSLGDLGRRQSLEYGARTQLVA